VVVASAVAEYFKKHAVLLLLIETGLLMNP
jgi:hypothetical protein